MKRKEWEEHMLEFMKLIVAGFAGAVIAKFIDLPSDGLFEIIMVGITFVSLIFVFYLILVIIPEEIKRRKKNG